MRGAAAAAALIEQDDPVPVRVEGPALHPDPAPPCTTSAGLPSGLPQASQ
jgi:hypothetical protein